ncbi:MAG: Uma2 family endonuclease [Phycisphaeraceae bacterium]
MATTVQDNLTTRRFSVDDYYRMQQAGILNEDDRVELIDGSVVALPRVTPLHAGTVNFLNHYVTGAASRAIRAVHNPIQLDRHNEPVPDVMLLHPRDDFYRKNHPTPADVFLLIEVADTTLNKDLHVKAPLYALHGVTEYWVIDLDGFQVHTHRDPAPQGYRDISAASGAQVIAPQAFPDHKLDLSKLFL